MEVHQAWRIVDLFSCLGLTNGGRSNSRCSHDGLGSTTGLTDDQAIVTGTYVYDAFSSVHAHTGADTEWSYTGEQRDPNGLMYLRARYYDPEIGRFVSSDPWMGMVRYPQSLNRYPYVVNRPVVLIDPYGLWSLPGPIRTVVDAAGNAVECVGNGFDCVEDAVESAGDFLGDLGYVDVNGTICLGVCLTGGLQMSFGEGFHPYVGTGYGFVLPTASVSVAPGEHIVTGWACQSAVGAVGPVGGTFQFGYAGYDSKEGPGFFHEYGVSVGMGHFGFSNTCYHVF